MIDSNNHQEIIKLRENESYYSPSINFNEDQIEICPQQQNEINIIKELLNNPNEYKLYEINYQQKEYQ